MLKRYSYEYEWDREYCYPNSNVLINRLNITSEKDLVAAEREITSLKIALAISSPIKGRFDFNHLKKIHRYIFGDIYAWAGKPRTVNISKGNQFCLSQNIELYADGIFTELQKENYLRNSGDNAPYRLAYYMSEINVLHPFREGNGRTQRLFIMYLANYIGCKVNFSDVSAEEMIEASADAFACEYKKINSMFERITSKITT